MKRHSKTCPLHTVAIGALSVKPLMRFVVNCAVASVQSEVLKQIRVVLHHSFGGPEL